jgi:hypothetical protein
MRDVVHRRRGRRCGLVRRRSTVVGMGYQTDFVGYLHVTPELNDAEIEVVNEISHSIYLDRRESGLRVAAQREEEIRRLGAGAPGGWSNWTACAKGCCLSYDGGDKANHMVPWLKFLMDALLVPGASVGGRPGFETFTCDHVLNGMVVGSRRDNRELYAITARENDVEVELLWPGVPGWSTYPPLKYQTKIDRFREWVEREGRSESPWGAYGLAPR